MTRTLNVTEGARRSGSSLAQEVYGRLKTAIITCALEPGREVSEIELAELLEVSKTPIREALNTLRSEGFVRTYPRRGYQIIPVTISDVNEIFEVRGILESSAAGLTAVRITDQELERLSALASVDYSSTKSPSLTRFIEANREFHVAIAKASGNARLQALVGRHLAELERLFYLGARFRDINTEVRGDHEKIVEALRRREPAAAHAALFDHNSRTRDYLMRVLTEKPTGLRLMLSL